MLLLAGVSVAVALTWILPAGAYQRRTDPATGRDIVVPGTYARVAPSPVGPMAALMAVPRGIVAGADIIVTVLLVGGAFALVDAAGALARLVARSLDAPAVLASSSCWSASPCPSSWCSAGALDSARPALLVSLVGLAGVALAR